MDSLLHAEMTFAEVLAGLLGAGPVSVDSHFFEDLGADSMVMAQFCARIRKREDVPSVSMKDIYRYPTIRHLAVALTPADAIGVPADAVAGNAAEAGDAQGAAAPRVRAPAQPLIPALPPVEAQRVSGREYFLCGTLQLLVFLVGAILTAVVMVVGFEWISAATGTVEVYLRSVLFGAALFLGLFLLPILAKWTIVGRWEPARIRIWSPAYVRFWIAKSLIQKNPMVRLMIGSPLYSLYLRALGAKVGPGVLIFSQNVPVCTDLITIGAGTVVHKDSFLTGYRAEAGVIRTGPVTLGADVLVGEATVLDVDTAVGDGGQLGHSSALYPGQRIPAGERWHGSPAQPTEVDYRTVGTTERSAMRGAVYTAVQVLNLVAVSLPLGAGIVVAFLLHVPQVKALESTEPHIYTSGSFYGHLLLSATALYFGLLLVGLLLVVTVPRLLNRALTPDTVYPLYGWRYGIQRTIARMTNRKTGPMLFGDSSAIVHYLRWLGYDLSPVEQTGSNFGLEMKHENPYLSSIGTGTVVADGLSLMNAEFSSTSFRVTRTSIGRHNFVGNKVVYPAQGKTGDNCLLATKVMVPIDGEVRENVGLLGSPCFEIPRSVARDGGFDLASKDEQRRRLTAKNWHNTVTATLHLLVRWIYFFAVTLLLMGALDLYHAHGSAAVALTNIVLLVFSVTYWMLVDRSVSWLGALRPQGCSIYDQAFWRHERFWKVPAHAYITVFDGTPFKPVVWRLLGARVGRRLFDDGCGLVEKTFVSIGDDCTLNAGAVIQCHSQEDGAFKSDRSTLGAGATLGVGAFVHYGVTIGDGAVLAPDSFLMKGEEVPPHAQWGGNPARDLRDDAPAAEPTTPKAVPEADTSPEVDAVPEADAEVDDAPPAWLSSGAYAEAVSGGKTRWES